MSILIQDWSLGARTVVPSSSRSWSSHGKGRKVMRVQVWLPVDHGQISEAIAWSISGRHLLFRCSHFWVPKLQNQIKHSVAQRTVVIPDIMWGLSSRPGCRLSVQIVAVFNSRWIHTRIYESSTVVTVGVHTSKLDLGISSEPLNKPVTGVWNFEVRKQREVDISIILDGRF